MDIESLMKPALLEIPAFRRALLIKEVMEKYHLDSVIKMAANENQFGPSPKAIQAMKEEAETAYLYPDRQYELIDTIAGKYGVKPENIMVSSGATGIINGIGETFLMPGDEVIMSSMPYQQYPIVVRKNQGKVITIPVKEDLSHDLDKMLSAITEKTKLIMICNPGNPTSVAEDPVILEEFIKAVPEQVLVMIDEAYLDFATTPGYKKSMMALASGLSNLIVVRTFSKLYALAGMRIGFAVSSPEIITCLGRGGTVLQLNRLGIAAAIASLGDTEFEKASYESNKTGKELLTDKLKSYGWKVYPSDTNFLYFDTGLDISGLMEELLKRGIIIRNFDLNRISVGIMEQNRILIKALEDIMESGILQRRQQK